MTKYLLGMAGEHLVAGELLRREVRASITLGNAKAADIVLLNEAGTRAVVVEVKTSRSGRWPVGSVPPAPSDLPWVFVLLRRQRAKPRVELPPRYFVLTARELNGVLTPDHMKYQADYFIKNGREFDAGSGVCTLKLHQAEKYAGAWDTVLDQVRALN